jgi:hypothetical protein
LSKSLPTPNTSDLARVAVSVAEPATVAPLAGDAIAAVGNMMSGVGGVTVTVTPPDGASLLSELSVARLRITTWPCVLGVHANVHAVVPAAGDHVVPPLVDTSTPATVPPPMSPAVPAIVVGVPLAIDAPDAGDVIAAPAKRVPIRIRRRRRSPGARLRLGGSMPLREFDGLLR